MEEDIYEDSFSVRVKDKDTGQAFRTYNPAFRCREDKMHILKRQALFKRYTFITVVGPFGGAPCGLCRRKPYG